MEKDLYLQYSESNTAAITGVNHSAIGTDFFQTEVAVLAKPALFVQTLLNFKKL